jgi:hypothetical protein
LQGVVAGMVKSAFGVLSGSTYDELLLTLNNIDVMRQNEIQGLHVANHKADTGYHIQQQASVRGVSAMMIADAFLKAYTVLSLRLRSVHSCVAFYRNNFNNSVAPPCVSIIPITIERFPVSTSFVHYDSSFNKTCSTASIYLFERIRRFYEAAPKFSVGTVQT